MIQQHRKYGFLGLSWIFSYKKTNVEFYIFLKLESQTFLSVYFQQSLYLAARKSCSKSYSMFIQQVRKLQYFYLATRKATIFLFQQLEKLQYFYLATGKATVFLFSNKKCHSIFIQQLRKLQYTGKATLQLDNIRNYKKKDN